MEGIERIRRIDIFSRFETYSEEFAEKEWQVVFLFYRDGMSLTEIAKKIGLGRPAVSNRLNRAKRKWKKLERARRREAWDQINKHQKESEE